LIATLIYICILDLHLVDVDVIELILALHLVRDHILALKAKLLAVWLTLSRLKVKLKLDIFIIKFLFIIVHNDRL